MRKSLRKNLEVFRELAQGEQIQQRLDSESEGDFENETDYTRGQRVEF